MTALWEVDDCRAGGCAGGIDGRDEGNGAEEVVAKVDVDETDVNGGVGFEPVNFAATARARAA